MNIALFLISILLVFIGCDLFTNGIEWIGRKFELSESVTRSILAAIGTARAALVRSPLNRWATKFRS